LYKDDLRVVLRHEDNLRIGRLDDDNVRVALILHTHGLVLIALEGAHGISLLPETLYGIHNHPLIRSKRLPDHGEVVDVVGHHVEDLRKIYKRDERRIEALLLRRIGARLSA
jgi:hypothetical protein